MVGGFPSAIQRRPAVRDARPSLLRKIATRILELDRGQITSWPCNYETYLVRKEAILEAEARQNSEFDKKLAKEEVWIRTGVQARRTRNEGPGPGTGGHAGGSPRPARAAGRGKNGNPGGRTIRAAW